MLTDISKKEATGFEETSQQIGAAVDSACSCPQPLPDFTKRWRSIICHDAAIEMSPYVFDGVEFGCIRRQPFEFQPSILGGLLDIGKGKTAFMGGQTIPEEDNPSSKFAMQRPQKIHEIRTLDRAFMEAQAEPDRATTGSTDQYTDGGETLPVEIVDQFGGAATRPPGAAHGRLLGKTALVEKSQEGLETARFFLIAGQVLTPVEKRSRWRFKSGAPL